MNKNLVWFGLVFVTAVVTVQISFIPPAHAEDEAGKKPAATDVSFFCKTRYGNGALDKEQQRQEACEKGFSTGDCSSAAAEDGIKEACEAGIQAPKINSGMRSKSEMETVTKQEGSRQIDMRSSSISGQKVCGNTKTAYVECRPSGGTSGIEATDMWYLFSVLLNILLALFIVAAVGVLIWAGTLYASSADNAAKLNQAKKYIRNVLIAVVAYVLLYAFLQFLIPGGIFK